MNARALLLFAAAKHFGYRAVDGERQAWVWNIGGSAAMLAFLIPELKRTNMPAAVLVIAWWMYEEVLVAACSGWQLVTPWVAKYGENLCTEKLGTGIDSISLVCIGALIARVSSERRK